MTTVTASDAEAEDVIQEFESAFFTSALRVSPVSITGQGYAYLHAAQANDGALELSLDTFIVEEGDETSEMVIYNNDPSLAIFAVSEDANIWLMPRHAVHLGMQCRGQAELLSTHISVMFCQWFLSAFFAVLLWGTNRLDGTAGRYDSPAHMMAYPCKNRNV